MFPTLLFGVQTYAVTLAAGFLLGTYLAVHEGRRVGIARWAIIDVAFWCLVLGMVGARVMFVGVGWETFVDACVAPERVGLSEPDCTWALRFWEGGMVFYGSVIGGVVALVWYARRYNIKLLLLLDTAAPTLAVGHMIGRVGCLAAGCCWGAVCETGPVVGAVGGAGLGSEGGWGVQFPKNTPAYKDFLERGLIDTASEVTPHLHPTQLYEGAGEVFILLFLVLWRSRKRAHGEVVGWWLILYGVLRVVTEMWRGDALRGHWVTWRWEWFNVRVGLASEHVTLLSTSQVIGVGAVVVGVVLLVRLRRSVLSQHGVLLETGI